MVRITISEKADFSPAQMTMQVTTTLNIKLHLNCALIITQKSKNCRTVIEIKL